MRDPRRPARLRPQPWWLILAATLAIAPHALISGDRLLIGHVNGESTGHLFMQTLVRRAFLAGDNPFLLSFPGVEEATLYPNDILVRVLAALLGGAVGDVAACNLLALGQVALLGLATMALARELGVARWPATFAGLFMVLDPCFLGFLACGRFDSINTGWALLLCWLWLRTVKQPSWRRGAWLGLGAAALVWTSPNLAFLAALVAPPASLIALLRRPRRLIGPFVLAALLAGVLGGISIAALLHGEGDEDGRLSWESADREAPALVEWIDAETYGDDASILASWSSSRLQEQRWNGPWYELPTPVEDLQYRIVDRFPVNLHPWVLGGSLAPGLVPLLVALLGLRRAPRRTIGLLAVVLLLQLLGFGAGPVHSPALVLPGREELLVIRSAPLLSWIPGFGTFTAFGLLRVLASAVAAVAAAYGLAAVSSARWRWLLPAVGLLWLLEVQLLGPTPVPLGSNDMTVPAPFAEALDEGEGAVLLLPYSNELSMFLHTVHGRPVVTTWNDPQAPLVWDQLTAALLSPDGPPPGFDARALLRDAGVDTVVVIPDFWPQDHARMVRAFMERQLGPPQASTAPGWVWIVGP